MKFKTKNHEIHIYRNVEERKTVAFVYTIPLDETYIGVAWRNPKDNDNKDLGRRFALRCAIKSLSRADRKEIFAEYDRIIKQGRVASSPAVRFIGKSVTASIRRTNYTDVVSHE